MVEGRLQPKKEQKILHVVLSMAVGGAEKLVYDMVRHARFTKNRPIVCCLDALGELGGKLQQDGYAVYVKKRRSGVDWGIVPWLREVIAREQVTVVHAHQYTPLFYAATAAFLAGRIKVVYTEHGRLYPERCSFKRFLFNPVLSLGVDHLVSISDATAKAMAKYDNLPLSRIKVIHNGVDLSKMNPSFDRGAKRMELGLNETCRVLGTAARLEEIKNIPMLLRMFKQVLQNNPDTILLIAGQGSQSEHLGSLASALQIADRVKFVGLRFDLTEIYPLFDVFLLGSYTEGISITLLEAMASRVPAVVTAVGGNTEVVIEGDTGYLVPVDADDTMAERVGELLADSVRARRMGSKGRDRVEHFFSFTRMIDLYHNMYS